ncbi:MAG: ABC transporter permease [Candidatus Lernaella stagnicola]|nr:ABC transporter permease [Candidatus Lernaella stagnicola]
MKTKHLRAFWAAMRIGWEIESNWTKWPLYLLYAAVRPLALCLLLYFLFKVVSATPADDPRFVAVFVGNAFFTIFGTMASSLSWAVISDREHYQLIRYVYIAPAPFKLNIMGRAVTFLIVALSSVVIVLVVGRLTLDLPIGLAQINWPLLMITSVLGVISTLALGLFFAGMLLVTARHSLLLAEGVGGMFMLLCGVLYPTTFLPGFLWPLALLSPVTYWIEGCRRAFGVTGFDANLAWLPTELLLLVLLALTVVTAAGGMKAFDFFEELAKRHGKIDQTTNY